jgi:hypothetical protein
MPSAISDLYDPLIARDLAAIPAAVRAFRAGHDSEELWSAIARFAVLAYAPSQHARHAVLATVAARELRDRATDERYVELLTECAIYAASSRQPWSEPPISDPPAIEPDQRGDVDEVREAVAAGDRLRAERWLAKRIDDPNLAVDFFRVAAGDFSDMGHKLIVAVAAWQLASIFDPRGRFATLRIATWEWTARPASPAEDESHPVDGSALWQRLIHRFVAEQGGLEAAHRLFLLDAAEQAAEIAGELRVLERVRRHLDRETGDVTLLPRPAVELEREIPAYRLARDYAECLKVHALVERLRLRHPELPLDGVIAAAETNRASSNFEEWSFA